MMFGGGEELRFFSAWFQLDWLMAVGVCDWSVPTTVLGMNIVPRGFLSLPSPRGSLNFQMSFW